MSDYIDREVLRRAVFDASWWNSQDEDVAYDVLESVLAADVVPVRHGWWLFYCKQDCIHAAYVCSECKRVCKNDINHKFHYCPHCGAKMDTERMNKDGKPI